MYAKVINGELVEYPYSVQQLYADNSNTSFPAHLTDEILEAFNVVRVVVTGAPEHDSRTHVATQSGCSFVPERNRWETTWEVREMTPEESAKSLESQWGRIREERNKLLSSCDWTQLDDTPLDNSAKLAWATYRQALRDLTDQQDPFNISWPAQP